MNNLIEPENNTINVSQNWKQIYDRYSSLMYGVICELTSDRELANEILIEIFYQLKENEILSKVRYSICPFLLRYTNNFAIQYLRKAGNIPEPISGRQQSKLIHFLCTQYSSIKEIASILNLTEREAKKRIHQEVLKFRNHNINKMVAAFN